MPRRITKWSATRLSALGNLPGALQASELNQSMFELKAVVPLINNAALLISLGLLYDILLSTERGSHGRFRQILVGLILGGIGVAVMLTSWQFGPGLVFDTRSILLSIAALFYGVLPAALAMVITAVFRLVQGGGGAFTGVLVVVISVGLGLAWRYGMRQRLHEISLKQLYIFGLVVHLAMLAAMLTLPWPTAKSVLASISVPVILIYPVGTALLGKLMITRLTRSLHEKRIAESEVQYRSYVENAPYGILVADENGRYVEANKAACNISGYSREELLNMSIADLTPREEQERVLPGFESLQRTGSFAVAHHFLHKEHGKRLWNVVGGKLSENRFIGFVEDITQQSETEEALRQSEKRFRLLVEDAPDAIFVFVDRKFVYLNQKALSAFGASGVEDLLGQPVEERVHPENRELVQQQFEGIFKFGTVSPFIEGYALRMDGSVFEAESSAVPINWGGEEGGLVFFRDISERKAMERELNETKAILQAAMDHSQAGVAIADAPDGRLRYVNEAGLQIRGQSRAVLIDGVNISNCSSAWDIRHLDGTPYKPEDTPLAKAILQEEANSEELIVRRDSGEDRIVLTNAAPVFDAQGEITSAIAIFLDVTEMKEAEIELERIFTLSPDMICIADIRAIRFLKVNPAFTQTLGWSEEELRASQFTDFIHPDDQPASRKIFEEDLQQGKRVVNFENRYLCKDGSYRWLSWVCHPQPAHGVMYAVAHDVTAKKGFETQLITAVETAEAANKSKTQFLANMSHEIRTPLNSILGMLQLVRLSGLNDEQVEFIDTAIQSSKRLTRLLSDILDISKVEAGRLDMGAEPFDIYDAMNSVAQLFAPVAAQKSLEFHVDIDPAVPRILLGDSIRVQQVLCNLVSNAIKFTDNGRVEAYASLIHSSETNVRILFTVSDTGLGIADAQFNRLFQAFTQAKTDAQRQFEGTGLGLVISKKLVDLMGGSMTVDSQEGKGTTFYVSIPFDVSEVREVRELEAVPNVSGETLKVLVAEDDMASQYAMQKMLERMGHFVKAVNDGGHALDALRDDTYDLVVMDIQMPVMDGVLASKAIRDGRAGMNNKDIPIIAMTAFAMTGDKEALLEAGMDAYLAKPVEMRELEKVVSLFTDM